MSVVLPFTNYISHYVLHHAYASYDQSCWYPEWPVQSHTSHGTKLVSRPGIGPSTFKSVIFCDLRRRDQMELTTNNACTTRATSSDLAMALIDPECMLVRAIVYVGVENQSAESAMPEPTVTTNKETV